jgi:signal transduction histidine kinase
LGERDLGVARQHGVPAEAGGTARRAWASDLQSLLGRAVRDVSTATGGGLVAAWGRDATGAPRLLGARLEGASLRHPDEACYAALAALSGATDLGAAGAPAALRRVAEEHGFSAAAPVAPAEAGASAVLLAGGAADPPGRVRPRTLAALEAAARRVAGPAEAVFAAERLLRLDAEVQHLDRLAALGSLVAEIVHEIRNPLVSVKTFLQLLPERLHDPDFRERFLAVASDELRRVERLLDVILQHGRPRAPARSESEARADTVFESVAQLVGFRADERGVGLEVGDATGLPPLRIADDVLRQVVLNLVLNAIEVTPSGGTVRLSARETRERVELAVDDEGPGIPESLRPHLFDPFFSTKRDRPGGLGLSITRRLVEEAGGVLEVRDREGRGASLRVTLRWGRPAPEGAG